MWYDFVESLQKLFYLNLKIISHFSETIFFYVLLFISLIDINISTSRNEIFNNSLTKVVIKIWECVITFFNRILLQPQHGFIEWIILLFEVRKLNLLPKDHFVKSTSKVSVNKFIFSQCLANKSSYKLKILQMVRINIGLWIRLIGISRGWGFKKSIIRVENFPWKAKQPLSCQSSCIITLFIHECDLKSPFELFGSLRHYLIEWFLKDICSTNFNRKSISWSSSNLWMLSEQIFFCFKIKEMWHFQYQPHGLFIKNSILRIEIFYDLEMNVFVFDKNRLDLLNIFNCVNAEDLIQELIIFSIVII